MKLCVVFAHLYIFRLVLPHPMSLSHRTSTLVPNLEVDYRSVFFSLPQHQQNRREFYVTDNQPYTLSIVKMNSQ